MGEGGGWVRNIVVMDVVVRGGERVVLVVVGGVIGVRVGGGVATEVLGWLMVECSRPRL